MINDLSKVIFYNTKNHELLLSGGKEEQCERGARRNLISFVCEAKREENIHLMIAYDCVVGVCVSFFCE